MTRDWEENSLRGAVEKDLGVLVEEKLDMSQPRKSTPSWAVPKEPWPTGQGGDSPFLSRESPSAALHPAPVSSAQEWCCPGTAGPQESTKMLKAGAALALRLSWAC